MKNIRRDMRIVITILCCCLVCGIKVHAAEEGKTYTVSQDGSGDFITIQSGVDAASSGDTLVIYPGIYRENVEIMAKTVNLTGIDKDTCVIEYNTVDYGKVPLTIAAGKVSNLTIRGQKTLDSTEVSRTVIKPMEPLPEYVEQMSYSGYAVHIDQNYLYGRELTFENCRIESFNSYCFGIGSRGDSTITLTECEVMAAGDGGCIYLHDVDTLEVGGISNLIIQNCILQSSLSPYIMTVHALSAQNCMYLTFQGVKVCGIAYEDQGGYSPMNMNTGLGVEPSKLHIMSDEQIRDYMSRDMLVQPVLEEGISYIRTSNNKRPIIWNKRHVFNIYNMDGLPGAGWCGLNNTWLTQDSYGNTLRDMNFTAPMPVLAD